MLGYFMMDLSNSVSATLKSAAVKDHVVLLVRIHGQVVDRRYRAGIQIWSQPGIFRRPHKFPGNVDPRLFWIAADISANCMEILAINKDPRFASGVWCFAENIGAIVDAVEINRLAVVVLHFSRRRNWDARHGGQG